MPTDFGKLLDRIKTDNEELKRSEALLLRAYQKLDSRITVLKAGIRIEPYDAEKSGLKIGFRRYHDGWHISTVIEGVGGILSEVPVVEAPPDTQVALMGHVGDLLEKISESIGARVKTTQGALKEADRLLSALP
jgi:hypothetical protein